MFIKRYSQISLFCFIILAIGGFRSVASAPAQIGSATPARITQPIDETKLVPLSGNTHPLATAQADSGPVPDSFALEHVFLQLSRGAEQENALAAFMKEQYDPNSANYRKWLAPGELGSQFGPSLHDIATISRWLSSHGFRVNVVHQSGMTIDFSGTAAQVREAFHTEIHQYNVRGERHIANASDPEIPAALAPAVSGVLALHDFRPKPQVHKRLPNFSFNFSNSEQYDVAPADFATIYNVNPLYKASKPVTGKGQTIAVIEDSDMNPSDWTTFRSAFGLSKFSGKLTQIHPGPGCSDPGKNGDEVEAAIDSEWAGAVAPDANVVLASCADTTSNAGIFIAAQNLIDSSTPPPIINLSFGACEAALGSAGNAFINALWQQAAGEGISVFVSSGDEGAAGCDDSNIVPTWATNGIAVNGFASTPYNVAVGGTDFLDTSEGTNSTYWDTSNSPTGKSALSYVPETPWNDSCAGSVVYQSFFYKSGVDFCNSSTGSQVLDIIAGSGGPSYVYSKPAWQDGKVFGNPADGRRDLPDVSLFSSNAFWSHALMYCMSDPNQGGFPCKYGDATDAWNNSAGGTSFAAPQFAGIQALINQKEGARQGNPNPVLYALAAVEYGSATHPNAGELYNCKATWGNQVCESCIFYDITVGDIDVPCQGSNNCYDPSGDQYGVLSTSDKSLEPAYPAHRGWDFATGLGSVNVTKLVNSWP
ncbi:MAG: S8/S53 family peptidase [Acidobacteriaceae bacterium]|nr:S8/S53 family peptidase [Acidobacteriaceae bacterium]MBV9778684.1 S8/S53 family peptidase [Acidobacteriaceae bacterium]